MTKYEQKQNELKRNKTKQNREHKRTTAIAFKQESKYGTV